MILKIGTFLTLEPSFSEEVERLQCKVVELKGNILYIDYPINIRTKKTVFITDGAQFRVTFRTENNEFYSFHTEVLGRVVQNIPMIMLHLPSESEFVKVQRREFVRVNTPVDVAVDCDGQYYQFVTEDISGGGLALKSPGPFPFKENEELEITIVLPFASGDIKYIITQAKVMRIIDNETFFIASMQFVDIDEFDQQLIVRFSFERQLMMRKKEVEI